MRRYEAGDDVDIVRELINRSLRILSGHLHSRDAFDRHEVHLRSDAFASELENLAYWVVIDSRRTIKGCGGWAPDLHRGAARIREVFVDPDATRCGVGSLVVRTAITDARGSGFDSVWVLSSQYAIPFYSSLGFITDGSLTTDDLPSMPMVLAG